MERITAAISNITSGRYGAIFGHSLSGGIGLRCTGQNIDTECPEPGVALLNVK